MEDAMKRFYLLFAIIVCVVLTLSAQGFYFEFGGGAGMSSTEYAVGYEENSSGGGWYWSYSESRSVKGVPLTKSGIGYDIGAKAGFGELFGLPFYLVGEVSWTKGNTWKLSQEYSYYESEPSYDWFYSNSGKSVAETDISHLFFGPGFVFYPSNNFQVAASIGLVNTTIEVDISEESIYQENNYGPIRRSFSMSKKESGLGFGFNLSGAIDIGDNSGFLLGGKFSFINNEVDLSMMDIKGNFDVSATYVGLFLKYRFKS